MNVGAIFDVECLHSSDTNWQSVTKGTLSLSGSGCHLAQVSPFDRYEDSVIRFIVSILVLAATSGKEKELKMHQFVMIPSVRRDTIGSYAARQGVNYYIQYPPICSAK